MLTYLVFDDDTDFIGLLVFKQRAIIFPKKFDTFILNCGKV